MFKCTRKSKLTGCYLFMLGHRRLVEKRASEIGKPQSAQLFQRPLSSTFSFVVVYLLSQCSWSLPSLSSLWPLPVSLPNLKSTPRELPLIAHGFSHHSMSPLCLAQLSPRFVFTIVDVLGNCAHFIRSVNPRNSLSGKNLQFSVFTCDAHASPVVVRVLTSYLSSLEVRSQPHPLRAWDKFLAPR